MKQSGHLSPSEETGTGCPIHWVYVQGVFRMGVIVQWVYVGGGICPGVFVLEPEKTYD